MEDIKKAYETLGLEPFASKDLVEQRYDQAFRKDRARSKQAAQGIEPPADDFDFEKITAAYRAILDYETKKYTEAFEQEEYGKYKKMAGQAKKIDHFWRYYKVHTFVAIGLVIALIYGIVAFMNHQEEKRYLASLPPVDVSVSFIGNYFNMSEEDSYEATNQKFLADFPDFQRVVTDLIFVPEDPSMQYAYLQKAMVMLMTETPDIYIADEPMKDWTLQQGMYIELDKVASLAHLADSKYAVKGAVLIDGLAEEPVYGEEHMYMLDLTESDLAKNLQIAHNKLLVGIRANAPNAEKALQFIEYYAATLPDES
ncbi:hypothetical protein ACFP56_07940 [Paenibacillus septentrionalis]|uniref:J domain-containing protein n=1 Tax=Paenibacillus septentrionalis TaxID=429342 RepID=A0ABW1V248_9BACL